LPAGSTGRTRIQVLHDAAAQFVQLVPAGDAVGMVRFDDTAFPGIGVTTLGDGMFDPNRIAVLNAVAAVAPNGATSIGNGLTLGRSTLDPVGGFARKAVVVFTDGLENTSLYIGDVLGLINDRTFAIGLGNEQQVSTGALTTLTHQTGGYLLVTGPLVPGNDDFFRVSKYFMQVLAGVVNNDVVVDPTGVLDARSRVRIPFVVADSDIETTVILLTDTIGIPFDLETPHGEIITPATAAAAGAKFEVGHQMSFYRFTLPLLVKGQEAKAGTWYAILGADAGGQSTKPQASFVKERLRYSLSVHAHSNLRFKARTAQTGLEPGATVSVIGSLEEYGYPAGSRGTVTAIVSRPDGSSATLPMPETEPGRFETSLVAALPGVYRFRVMAQGATMRGMPFTREQDVTAAVLIGGNAPPRTTPPDQNRGAEAFCALAKCLVGTFEPVLRKAGVDPQSVLKCIGVACERRLGPPSKDELARREGTA
jgi:hypothetical protein